MLLIYSDNDKLCTKAAQYDPLLEALKGKENVQLVLVENKGHNPNYTHDAVTYKDAFFADLTKKTKKKKLRTAQQQADFRASYDWERMTMQDESIWEMIYNALQA